MKFLYFVFIVLALIGLAIFEETERPAICNLPIKTGGCKGAFPNYAFDVEQNKCVRFFYGGCAGNENNFETLEECKQKCETL